MEATVSRKQTAFRFRTDLLENLKKHAKAENRSLNNYVESVLLDVIYHQPNEETVESMLEAEGGKNLETLNLKHFDDYNRPMNE